MKRVLLGDTHGRSFWKLALHTQEWDEAVFIGDYFDTHDDISAVAQIANFKDICQFKRQEIEAGKRKVVMLIGNHDEHYFPYMGYTGTSGYQAGVAASISQVLTENEDLLQMAYSFDNFLCTHAGVGETWLNKQLSLVPNLKIAIPLDTAERIANFVNELWKHKPKSFKFNGLYDMSGDDIGQTPIWIRPYSLAKDSQELCNMGIIQVVGHTGMKKLDIDGKNPRSYVFVDTLGHSGEYLIINDGKLEVGKV